MTDQEITPEARLATLGLVLPPPPPAAGRYVQAVEAGGLLFVCGQGPLLPDGSYATGRVGAEVDVATAQAHARLSGMLVLATVRAALGSLDRVDRVVKVHGMVNAVEGFGEQPIVINGFSDLMIEVFGARGWHARAAVGHNSLPGNMTVEIESIFAVVRS